MKRKKNLVTGRVGFVGSHLCERLAQIEQSFDNMEKVWK